jgi:hypothetical protein
MGTESKRLGWRKRMILSAAWAVGIGITLVEMQLGMDYVLSHVVGHVSAIVGWLPMIGTLVAQFGG